MTFQLEAKSKSKDTSAVIKFLAIGGDLECLIVSVHDLPPWSWFLRCMVKNCNNLDRLVVLVAEIVNRHGTFSVVIGGA